MIKPIDCTPEEQEIYDLLMGRIYRPIDVSHIYELIDDPIDKFLLAYVYDLGRTRRSAERALGLSKATLWKRLKRVKQTVYKYAFNNHLVNTVDKI